MVVIPFLKDNNIFPEYLKTQAYIKLMQIQKKEIDQEKIMEDLILNHTLNLNKVFVKLSHRE